MDPKARAEELRTLLRDASHRYYVLDAPTLSDAEYDRAFRELEELEKAHPELQTADSPTRRVGAAPSEKFAKVTHRRQMMSLANAMNEEEFLEFDGRVHRLLGDEPVRYVVEPKLDGLAVTLAYENGRFVQGAPAGTASPARTSPATCAPSRWSPCSSRDGRRRASRCGARSSSTSGTSSA